MLRRLVGGTRVPPPVKSGDSPLRGTVPTNLRAAHRGLTLLAGVDACSAVEPIPARPAVEPVPAGATFDDVVPGLTVQPVRPGSADETIVPGTAFQKVLACFPDEYVAELRAPGVLDVSHPVGAPTGCGSPAEVKLHRTWRELVEDEVEPFAAVDHVVAGIAVECVVVTSGTQDVVAPPAVEIVLARVAAQDIGELRADQPFESGEAVGTPTPALPLFRLAVIAAGASM